MIAKHWMGAAAGLLAAIGGLTTAATADDARVVVPAGDREWISLGDGPVQFSPVWGDMQGAEHAFMVRVPAGAELGAHIHSADYHGVVLQGLWVHTFGDGTVANLPAGSYIMQPAGEVHQNSCAGTEECMVLLHQHAPWDFGPPPE